MPSARFSEKLKPGIGVEFLLIYRIQSLFLYSTFVGG
jgi:hypothetical protein